MGYQLHYAARYDVEYAGGYFNWQTEEANRFLREMGITPDDDSCTVFEVNKEDFKAKVEVIRQEYSSKASEKHPVLKPFTYGAVLKILDEIIAGTTGEFIHLEWF